MEYSYLASAAGRVKKETGDRSGPQQKFLFLLLVIRLLLVIVIVLVVVVGFPESAAARKPVPLSCAARRRPCAPDVRKRPVDFALRPSGSN